MDDLLNVFNLNIFLKLIRSTIRMSTPITLAAMGLIITELSAVTNIGIEGIMLTTAFVAVAVSYFFGSWLLALIMAMVVGAFLALIMAVLHLKFKANIFVAGIAINLFAISITRFLLTQIFNTSGSFYSPEIVPIPRISILLLENIPILNEVLNAHLITDYLGVFLVFVVFILIYKTVWGLRLRFVGNHPASVEAAGINVEVKKYQALIISGVFGGLAGAHLSLGYTTQFIEQMTNGRGFIGVAAMFFGGIAPFQTWLASLFFGFTDALGNTLQNIGYPSQFMLMIPYIATVIAITIGTIRKLRKEESKDIFK